MENKKWTWRDELKRHKGSFTGDFKASYEGATRMMQVMFPGDYIVEEYYNPKNHTFDLRLKFGTPEEETLFLLKYE